MAERAALAAPMPPPLPPGWAWTTLGETTTKIADGSHNPPRAQASGVPMLSARNVADDRIDFTEFRYISRAEYDRECLRVRIEPGDVLLTIVGSIGRSAVVRRNQQEFAAQRSVAVLKPRMVDPGYMSRYLQSPASLSTLRRESRGVAQKGVYLGQVSAMPFPIAPRSEQRRIVAKIEELFSQLDAGVEELKKARAQLKRYRQSVLKAAFEGRLTEDRTNF